MEIKEISESKIRLIRILGKTFILVYLIILIFNAIPINLLNPQWASNISMLIVDTFSLLFIGLSILKYSVIKKDELVLINNDFNQVDNSIDLHEEDKINNSKLINIFIFNLTILVLIQVFIFFRGLNVIDNQIRVNFNSIEESYTSQISTIKYQNIDEGSSDKTIAKKLNDLKQLRKNSENKVVESANLARFELIKQRFKVVIVGLLYVLSLKLIQRI